MELAKYSSYQPSFGVLTSAVTTYEYNEENLSIKRVQYHFPKELCLDYPWEDENMGNDFSADFIDDYEQTMIIHRFASELLENMEDINPKYAKLINKHFWDLI